jgi:hypothetical protein
MKPKDVDFSPLIEAIARMIARECAESAPMLELPKRKKPKKAA